MEPYNVKIITYPDLTKQYRIYNRIMNLLSKLQM